MPDVIVLGAGPGGLACAAYLAQHSKLDVLVLDRKSVIGPKVCAGGLSSLSEQFPLPAEKILIFPNQKFVVNGKNYPIVLEKPLRTISRYDLGQHQLQQTLA